MKSALGGKGIMTRGGPCQIVCRDASRSCSGSVPRKKARRSVEQLHTSVAEEEERTSGQDLAKERRPPFAIDFKYPGRRLFCCDGDACAKLVSQLVLTETPFPSVEHLAFKKDYEDMLKSLFQGIGRANYVVTNYDDQVKALLDDKAELEKDVAHVADANADLVAALEVFEEKCPALSSMCGYDPDNIMLGDASVNGWKSRAVLSAELESSKVELESTREELRKYKDLEATVARYLGDREMAADAISILSESLGRLKSFEELKLDGVPMTPARYEIVKAAYDEQRGIAEGLEVFQLDVEDFVRDEARDLVLGRRAEQEKVRDAVKGDGSAQDEEHEALVGTDEVQLLQSGEKETEGERVLAVPGDVRLTAESEAPKVD